MSKIQGIRDRGATKYFHGREKILAEFQNLLADSDKSKGGTRSQPQFNHPEEHRKSVRTLLDQIHNSRLGRPVILLAGGLGNISGIESTGHIQDGREVQV